MRPIKDDISPMVSNKDYNHKPVRSAATSDQVGEIMPLWRVEKNAIEQAIENCNGNIPKAAVLLEINPSTIYRKLQSWKEK